MKRDIDVFTYLYKHIKELLDTKVEQEIDASEIGEATLINADSLGGRYTANDIDTIRDKIKSPTVVITQAEYDALPDEKKNTDIVYYITDAPFDSPNVVDISQEEYNALPDNVKYDGRFYCIDGTLYRLGRKFNNGVGNPNLLDNPFFTVNQRNQTTYNVNGTYCVDRWAFNYMTVSILDNGISVKKDLDQTTGAIHQFIERDASLCGQTLTISAIIDDNLISHTFVMPTAESGNYARYEHIIGNIKIFTLDWNNYSGNIKQQFGFYLLDDTLHTIKCVKVESGDKSTLKFDSAPDYTTELLKCQKYFCRVYGSALGVGQNDPSISVVSFGYKYIIPMRVSPTFSCSTLRPSIAGLAHTVATTTGDASVSRNTRYGFIVNTIFPTSYYWNFSLDDNFYIDCSADL